MGKNYLYVYKLCTFLFTLIGIFDGFTFLSFFWINTFYSLLLSFIKKPTTNFTWNSSISVLEVIEQHTLLLIFWINELNLNIQFELIDHNFQQQSFSLIAVYINTLWQHNLSRFIF